MKSERRSHNRVKPDNIRAEISHHQSSEHEIDLIAEIINISRSGIRIKLSKPLNPTIHDHLKITMVLPESGVPFTVHGILKHKHSDS